MTYPPENPLSAKAQFFIATYAGDQLAEIIDSSRQPNERKKSPEDDRLTFNKSLIKRATIVELVGGLEPSLGCLAIEWALDKDLRSQINSDADPIKFQRAEPDYSLEAYAGMLALTARVTKRQATGKYSRLAVTARPQDTIGKVVLQYRKTKASTAKKSS